MNTDQILSAKYHAHALSDHALLAHYAGDAKEYHVMRMHEDFLKLANEMGYDVLLHSAEQEDEAA